MEYSKYGKLVVEGCVKLSCLLEKDVTIILQFIRKVVYIWPVRYNMASIMQKSTTEP